MVVVVMVMVVAAVMVVVMMIDSTGSNCRGQFEERRGAARSLSDCCAAGPALIATCAIYMRSRTIYR